MMTYLWIVGIPFVGLLFYDIFIGKRMVFQKKFQMFLGIFTIAMLLFDFYLTAWPVVLYNPALISGLRIGTIPIEDFLYGYAMILFLFNAQGLINSVLLVWKKVLVSSRPFSWINTAYPAALPIFLFQKTIGIDDLLIVLFFLIPYNFLVYGVNDVFDYESDKNNPRKQSIEGGLLEPKYHAVTLWIIGVFVLAFLPLMASRSLLLFGLFVGVILNAVFYSAKPLRLKSIPLLDSISSSLHFVLPAVVGLVWIGIPIFPTYIILAFFVWGIASHILGAIPDIVPDIRAKERTVATVFGKRKSVLLAGSGYIAAIWLSFVGGVPIWILIFLIPYFVNVIIILKLKESEDAQKNFRFFMYYNLVFGAITTMYVIYKTSFL